MPASRAHARAIEQVAVKPKMYGAPFGVRTSVGMERGLHRPPKSSHAWATPPPTAQGWIGQPAGPSGRNSISTAGQIPGHPLSAWMDFRITFRPSIEVVAWNLLNCSQTGLQRNVSRETIAFCALKSWIRSKCLPREAVEGSREMWLSAHLENAKVTEQMARVST